MTYYAELQILSAFSFLEGASQADELVAAACALGHNAISIADRNTLAGVVRMHAAVKHAKRQGFDIELLVGARLDLIDGQSLLCYPTDRAAYGRLSRLISLGRRRAEKGQCKISIKDVIDYSQGQIFIYLPPNILPQDFQTQIKIYKKHFPQFYVALTHSYKGDDAKRMQKIADICKRLTIDIVATNNVIMHDKSRKPLADILTCMREKIIIEQIGKRALINGEACLKTPELMHKIFKNHPIALNNIQKITNQISFNLNQLSYEYPKEVSPNGRTAYDELIYLIGQESKKRYPYGQPKKVESLVAHELNIIKIKNISPYFLTVFDIVRFARSQDILCQGRGSAANSAICYILGITAVPPESSEMLFERFVSLDRDEPPDIDVDFEHERREEVIQYIYQKYGRDRAGITATVTHFRFKGAMREVSKAMGMSEDMIDRLTSQKFHWSSEKIEAEEVKQAGFNPNDKRLRQTLDLAHELNGFPRHLGQHVGGFVITAGRLDELVPIENARMEDRSIIEWDKNDIDELGILKVDVLGLGMLTCIRKAFDLINMHYGKKFNLASVPKDDPTVYDMLCEGDSVGVFQVESRAQMAFLPRMKPRTYYDLVIEVAIVRPGPIQGGMVHPYIRRRNGEEKVEYPSPELEKVLKRTLGVPLFQEQAMKMAEVAAGFTPSEADGLRRSMATFKHSGTISSYKDKFISGMLKNGYDEEFAERCFKQIEGFGDYGFPESHAASFAILVYISAWIKCHYPDIFACAILNSQPMGFYAPAQLVRDARDHQVEIRPPDVNYSMWDNSLEAMTHKKTTQYAHINYALRIGLRQIKGIKQVDAQWLVAARNNGYVEPKDIWRRANISPKALEKLANADAFGSMNLKRRDVIWQLKGIKGLAPLPLFAARDEDDNVPESLDDLKFLPDMTAAQHIVEDYASTGLSLKGHPMKILRPVTGGEFHNTLITRSLSKPITVTGIVMARQRPGTAKGVCFITLEDDTGTANIITWPKIFEKYKREVFFSRLMRVKGVLEREGIVAHIIAYEIEDLSHLLDYMRLPNFPNQNQINKGGTVPQPTPNHPRQFSRRLFPSRDFH
ncbi:MAG: error-prone DNA polymerase [Alphaproteobacteria bacterium]|nr:error-prone DNA polymerase [Alphaproteobacteria bacterium]